MSDENSRRKFMKRAGTIGVTGLMIGSSTIGSAAADETVTVTGYAYHDSEDNSPIPDFSIIFSGPERYDADLSETDDEWYNFKAVPGEYSVLVRADGYQTITETVPVESGGIQQHDFVLEPRDEGTLTGTVVDTNGDPIDGGDLSLKSGNYSLSTSTDSNGQFELELQEGDWDVTTDLLEYDNETKTASITEGESTELDFELTANTNGTLHLLLQADGDIPATDITLIGPLTDDGRHYEHGHIEAGDSFTKITAKAGTYDVAIEPGDGYASAIVDDVEIEQGDDTNLTHELEAI